jgi:hypothetical protein
MMAAQQTHHRKLLKDRPTFGRPFLQSGMLCAPENENGVLFLFGMLAWQAGRCFAPTALYSFLTPDPALTRWANFATRLRRWLSRSQISWVPSEQRSISLALADEVPRRIGDVLAAARDGAASFSRELPKAAW